MLNSLCKSTVGHLCYPILETLFQPVPIVAGLQKMRKIGEPNSQGAMQSYLKTVDYLFFVTTFFQWV